VKHLSQNCCVFVVRACEGTPLVVAKLAGGDAAAAVADVAAEVVAPPLA